MALRADRAVQRVRQPADADGLFAALGPYLEHALQPLAQHISRDAMRAFILETRRELHDLAACRTVGGVYAESLTITKPGDNASSLEVGGYLGVSAPAGSTPDVTSQRW